MHLEAKFKTILENTIGQGNVESKQGMIDTWWKTIQDAYTEPQRHYHTIEHVNSMWTLLDSVPQGDINDVNVVGFAIFFHDIVYDPKAEFERNELESITQWQQFVMDMGVGQDLSTQVSNMIRATIKHGVPSNSPHDLPLFLDLDLEVLARPPAQYALYASQIRQEYAHYSIEDYCKGRAGVLQRLEAGDIYFTEYWRSRLSESARRNLKWEQDMLAKGLVLSPDTSPIN